MTLLGLMIYEVNLRRKFEVSPLEAKCWNCLWIISKMYVEIKGIIYWKGQLTSSLDVK